MRRGDSPVSQIRSGTNYVLAVSVGSTLTFQQWPLNVLNSSATSSQITFAYAPGPGLNFSGGLWDSLRANVPSTNTNILLPFTTIASLNNFTLNVNFVSPGTTWQLVSGLDPNMESAGPGFPTPVLLTNSQTGETGTSIITGAGTYTFGRPTYSLYLGMVRTGHVFSNAPGPGYLGSGPGDSLNQGYASGQLSVTV